MKQAHSCSGGVRWGANRNLLNKSSIMKLNSVQMVFKKFLAEY